MDYGKYKFNLAKKEKEARKNQKVISVKEIRFSPSIDTNDLNTKVNQASKFLKSGDKVKVSVRFRGRELSYMDNGITLLNQFASKVEEFGTVEKSLVTDRCNLSYSDFTNYRFFVLKNDLTNNAFYIVKACEENSSFRFDSTVFDATYVTTENVDDPVVTFGGVEYHTIPFNKLSNSANQNESNNFIPGESGSSLTDIIDNISDFTSDIWNAISSFMGLVTKFFNTLPEEFRYLSITSFTVLTFIAIIKFIKS